jgi:hypothetical protein
MIAYVTSIKYMLSGYAVILTVLALYLISLFVRWHNLQRDLKTLKDIKRDIL